MKINSGLSLCVSPAAGCQPSEPELDTQKKLVGWMNE